MSERTDTNIRAAISATRVALDTLDDMQSYMADGTAIINSNIARAIVYGTVARNSEARVVPCSPAKSRVIDDRYKSFTDSYESGSSINTLRSTIDRLAVLSDNLENSITLASDLLTGPEAPVQEPAQPKAIALGKGADDE